MGDQTFVGEVMDFQIHYENKTYWRFRVVMEDGFQIMVQIEGKNFKGMISVGDYVELKGKYKEGEPVKVKEVLNLTTNMKAGRS